MSTKPTYQEFEKKVKALEKEAAARFRVPETLGASEARYHALAEDQTELICRWLPDGTLTFVNQAFCRYFGKQPEDFIGNSFMPFIPKDYHEKLKNHFSAVDRQNPASIHEHPVILPNGEFHWQQWTSRAIFDGRGRIKEYQSVGRDIIDRLQAQQRIQEQEIFLQNIFEAIQDGISVLDQDLNILRINSAMEKWCLQAAPVEGRKCYAVYHKRTEPCNVCPALRALESGSLQVDIVPWATSPKTVEWFELYAFPMLDSAGKPASVIEYTRNVTDRVNAEQARQKACDEMEQRVAARTAELFQANELLAQEIAERTQVEVDLKKSEDTYRMLLETMNEAFTIIDENLALAYFNNKFLQMTGYSASEISGCRVTDFFDEPNQKILLAEAKKRKKGGHRRYEIVWTGKGGRKIATMISPQPIFDADGHFKGSFAVITDITKLKQTERELKEREKQLENKTSNLEEVNTALKVLLDKREQDRSELEENVLTNIRKMVKPYLDKLNNGRLDARQKTYLDILESALNDVVSPFTRHLSIRHLNLTPKEIEVANLVKYGKTTKEIADMLNLSSRTVESHRRNLRNKLSITSKKINLRAYLSSIP
jgi:PAS domain S-box-containing protein